MDPNLAVQIGLTVLNEAITLIKHVKEQSALTTEQIAAMADAQDLKNAGDIKALLAL